MSEILNEFDPTALTTRAKNVAGRVGNAIVGTMGSKTATGKAQLGALRDKLIGQYKVWLGQQNGALPTSDTIVQFLHAQNTTVDIGSIDSWKENPGVIQNTDNNAQNDSNNTQQPGSPPVAGEPKQPTNLSSTGGGVDRKEPTFGNQPSNQTNQTNQTKQVNQTGTTGSSSTQSTNATNANATNPQSKVSKVSQNNADYQNKALHAIVGQLKSETPDSGEVMKLVNELMKHANDNGGAEKARVIRALKALKRNKEYIQKVPNLARFTIKEALAIIDFTIFLVEYNIKSKPALIESYRRFFPKNVLKEDNVPLNAQQISNVFTNVAMLYLKHGKATIVDKNKQKDNGDGNKTNPTDPYTKTIDPEKLRTDMREDGLNDKQIEIASGIFQRFSGNPKQIKSELKKANLPNDVMVGLSAALGNQLVK